MAATPDTRRQEPGLLARPKTCSARRLLVLKVETPAVSRAGKISLFRDLWKYLKPTTGKKGATEGHDLDFGIHITTWNESRETILLVHAAIRVTR